MTFDTEMVPLSFYPRCPQRIKKSNIWIMRESYQVFLKARAVYSIFCSLQQVLPLQKYTFLFSGS